MTSEMIDPRIRRICPATRIVWTQSGNGRIENPPAVLGDDDRCCTLTPGTPAGPAFVVDFGRELNGGVCIETSRFPAGKQAKVRLRFGESVSEVMGQPTPDHALHDLTVELSFLSKQEIGHTGFRFLRLDLVDEVNPICIRRITAVALERPWEYQGRFECSDPQINQIWSTGARTVHLCCQDYLLDGIKRDRLVWVGDIHPQLHVIAHVFGNQEIVPASLDFVRQRTAPTEWMNGISSYSLWWIICIWDWYGYTGNTDFLHNQAAYLRELIHSLSPYIDADGHERLPNRFLDWAMAGNDQAIAEGLQALFTWAMTCAIRIFTELEDPSAADQCEKMLARLRSAPVPALPDKQVGALRVLAGIADPGSVNRDCLAMDPLRGLSTWFAYYVLQVRALAGDYAGCLDLLRTYWGGMLQLGATSFWEHFDIRWLEGAGRIDELPSPGRHDVHAEYGDHCFKGLRHSLCHGWAGGPTAWLSRQVLGVQARSPGFKTVAIRPHLGDLAYARGVVPTPAGPIQVEHTRQADGRVVSEWQVPDGIQVAE